MNMKSFKFFINLYGSPKVLCSDLLLCYRIGFDELFFFIKNIYIYIYMSLNSVPCWRKTNVLRQLIITHHIIISVRV